MFLHTRKLLVGLLIGLLIVTLTGCGEPSGVKTGAESDSAKSEAQSKPCLLYTSPSPRDRQKSRMPSSA